MTLGILRWALVLGAALCLPLALPAGGGASPQDAEVRQRRRREPWVADRPGGLRSSPAQSAPILTSLRAGTPLTPLRRWRAASGGHWLQVEISAPAGQPRRGWIAV